MHEPDPPEVLERFHATLWLVDIIARQVYHSIGRAVELDELLSAGREGLLNAARRFDAARSGAFRAYANVCIHGAMIDRVREMMALPRRAYERLAAYRAATLLSEAESERSSQGNDDTATEENLLQQLAVVATAGAVAMRARPLRAEPAAEIAPAPEDIIDEVGQNPEESFAQAELLRRLFRAIDELGARREIEVIRMIYFEGKSISEVARELKVNKAWISRLHARSMSRLAKRLQNWRD